MQYEYHRGSGHREKFSGTKQEFSEALEVFEVRGSYFVAAVFTKRWSFRNLGKKFSAKW